MYTARLAKIGKSIIMQLSGPFQQLPSQILTTIHFLSTGNVSRRRKLVSVDTEMLFHTSFVGMITIRLYTRLYTKTFKNLYVEKRKSLLFNTTKQKDKYIFLWPSYCFISYKTFIISKVF